MKQHTHWRLLAIAAATALALTACGGSIEDDNTGGGGGGGGASTQAAVFSAGVDNSSGGGTPTVQADAAGKAEVEITLTGDRATGSHDVRVDIESSKSQLVEKAAFAGTNGSTSQVVTFNGGKATVALETTVGETVTFLLYDTASGASSTPFAKLPLKVVGSSAGGSGGSGSGSDSGGSGSGGDSGGSGSGADSGGSSSDCSSAGSPAVITSTHPATEAEKCAILKVHNDARAEVGVPALTWSDAAANVAYSYAQEHANKGCGSLTHNANRGNYGENIAWGSGSRTVTNAVTQFVNEKQYYTYATNSCASGKVCGHYTQVIWKNTTGVGCGSAICSDSGVITVCNYTPPGNYVGQKPY